MKSITNFKNYFVVLTLIMAFFTSCGDEETPKDNTNQGQGETKSLTVDVASIAFENTNSSSEITITTDVDSWTISSGATSWLSLSETSGESGTTTITVTAEKNEELAVRNATLTVTASSVSDVSIGVTQEAGIFSYESFNTDPIDADETGMTSTAEQIAAQITLGWNLGNTLEVPGGETIWGNPVASKELIDAVKAAGFNAVRLPCSWDQYANQDTGEINITWLNRVKEVVQYCIDNDMYVLLNIHWDQGWLERHIGETVDDQINAKQKAYWEQIATHLRDFDEHLLFASANEPHIEGDLDADRARMENQMAVLNTYHQTCIDAVRSTGGKNAFRTIVVQGPLTNIDNTYALMNTLPTDTVDDRLMVEVHFYSPYQFALMTEDADWGKIFYYWGDFTSPTDTDRNPTWGEEDFIKEKFELMKTKFVDQGVPVVLGEFGAIRRPDASGIDLDLHLKARGYFNTVIIKECKANGLIPFYWDEGSITNNGFGIMNRDNNTVFDQEVLDGLKAGL